MKNGFTMLEIISVIVILGVMATLAIPAYNKSKEMAYDNQAKADLKLIFMSEKSYKYEMGNYYPYPSASDLNITTINNNLGLILAADSARSWNYKVASSGCGQATRNGGDGRYWYVSFTDVNATPQLNVACN